MQMFNAYGFLVAFKIVARQYQPLNRRQACKIYLSTQLRNLIFGPLSVTSFFLSIMFMVANTYRFTYFLVNYTANKYQADFTHKQTKYIKLKPATVFEVA